MTTIIAFFSGAALSTCFMALYALRHLNKLSREFHTAIDAWKKVAELKGVGDANHTGA